MANEALSDDALNELAINFLTSQRPLKDLRGLTDDEMEAIYTSAYTLYTHSKFDEAEKLFSILTQFDHYETKYWMGLGSCRQMLEQWAAAAESYGMATVMDNSNPIPLFHSAECLVQIEGKDIAIQALELVITLLKDKKEGEYGDLEEKTQSMLAKLREAA